MGAICCPWHASIFRIADGKMVRGLAATGDLCCEVKTDDGAVPAYGPRLPLTKRLIGPCLERNGNGEAIRCWRPCQMELRSRIR